MCARSVAAALEPIGDETIAKLMDAFAAAVTATLILIGATVGLGVRLGG